MRGWSQAQDPNSLEDWPLEGPQSLPGLKKREKFSFILDISDSFVCDRIILGYVQYIYIEMSGKDNLER